MCPLANLNLAHCTLSIAGSIYSAKLLSPSSLSFLLETSDTLLSPSLFRRLVCFYSMKRISGIFYQKNLSPLTTSKQNPATSTTVSKFFFLMPRNSRGKGNRKKTFSTYPMRLNIYNAIIVYIEFYSFLSAGFLCTV